MVTDIRNQGKLKISGYNYAMPADLLTVLSDVVLPNLNRIQTSQTEQRLETDRLQQNLDAFRAEMQQRFAELHADLAATRAQLELAEKIIRATETARAAEATGRRRGTLVH